MAALSNPRRRGSLRNIGKPTGLLDKEGQVLLSGDVVMVENTQRVGALFWNDAYDEWGLFSGCWYLGKDFCNPSCYGKFVRIPKDNGMRMSLKRVGTVLGIGQSILQNLEL